MASNIITQVSEESYARVPAYEHTDSSVDYNSKIFLNIRGVEFVITRDELMSLPESILLCLFPNGVFLDMQGQVISNLTEDDVVSVNFDPACFQYIMDVFSEAQHDSNTEGLSPQVSYPQVLNLPDSSSRQHENVLQTKPAIIVLREDLDYYVISPVSGLTPDQIRHLKLEVAGELVTNQSIFSGLGFKPELPSQIHQTLGSAEQHLFDMLCTSGFDPRGFWGNRSLEPSKCVISSLSLVRLKSQQQQQKEQQEQLQREQHHKDSETPPDSPSLAPVPSNASSRSRSRSRIANFASSASRAASRSLSKSRPKPDNTNPSKLLLFWRKPARKCWWSNQTVQVKVDPSFGAGEKITVKVHIRRVWTLELSVIGIQ